MKISFAPLFLAIPGIKFAGATVNDDPTNMKQSHLALACNAPSKTFEGNASPKRTTFGFI